MEDEVKNSSNDILTLSKGKSIKVKRALKKPDYDKKRCISVQLKQEQLNKIGTLASIFDKTERVSATGAESTAREAWRAAYSQIDYIALSPTGEISTKFSETLHSETAKRQILTLASDEERENAERELFDLINDYDELKANSLAWQQTIVQLEIQVEQLEEELKLKSLSTEQMMDHKLLTEGYQEKQKQIIELDTHNRLLALEVTQLREELEKHNSKEGHSHLPGKGIATQLLTGFIKDNVVFDQDKDLQMKALEMEILGLHRLLQQKDKQINKLVFELESRDVRRMTIEQELYSNSKQENKYKKRLHKASAENQDLQHRASELEHKLETQNTIIKVMEQKLADEQEVGRIADVEKERMRKKLQELGVERRRQDVTFMNLFDELMVDGEEFKREESISAYQEDDLLISFAEDTENDEGLFSPAMRFSSRRSNLLKSPSKRKTNLSALDEKQRMDKAAEEFFVMSTISIQLSLAEFYRMDEILADTKALWKKCLKGEIPMHKYYLFIETELRREYDLPDLAYRLDNPKKNPYCSLM